MLREKQSPHPRKTDMSKLEDVLAKARSQLTSVAPSAIGSLHSRAPSLSTSPIAMLPPKRVQPVGGALGSAPGGGDPDPGGSTTAMLSEENRDLKRKLHETEERMRLQSIALESSNSKLRSMMQERSDFADAISKQNQLTSEVYHLMKGDAEAAVTKLVHQSAEITQAANLRIRELEEELKNSEVSIRSLQQKLADSTPKASEIFSENARLSQEVSRLDHENSKMRLEGHSLLQERASLRQKLQDSQAQIVTARETVSALEMQLSDNQSRLQHAIHDKSVTEQNLNARLQQIQEEAVKSHDELLNLA